MGWSTLARYAAWIALAAFIVGGIWWGLSTIHNAIYQNGVTSERLIWEDRELQIANATARETSRLAEEAAETRRKFMRAIQNEQGEREKLSGTIIDMHIAGLSITADICKQRSPTSAEDSDTTISSERLTRIRLPEKIEGDILSMTEDAQVCVMQYHKLRDFIKALPNIEIVQ